MNGADLGRWATWNELMAQPDVWAGFAAELMNRAEGIRGWIAGLPVEEVWFCGAGTSAYIGDIAAASLSTTGARFRSVPTTDLVATPHRFLNGKSRPLVVSFGRSGQSTETIGVLDLLDRLAPDAPRLNITCNAQSTLATRVPASAQQRVLILPPATHDAGFAMTSSFTTMLLSALVLFGGAPLEEAERGIHAVAAAARRVLPAAHALATGMARPERVVFVGSGAGQYVAREAALKVMELTAGAVPALSESCLGFRHGPKSFMTAKTRVVLFHSADAPARLYDADLDAELRQQYGADAVLSVGPDGAELPLPALNLFQPLLQVLIAQVAAVIWSDQLGLTVDDPFVGAGTLSRVVAHVRLHAAQG